MQKLIDLQPELTLPTNFLLFSAIRQSTKKILRIIARSNGNAKLSEVSFIFSSEMSNAIN